MARECDSILVFGNVAEFEYEMDMRTFHIFSADGVCMLKYRNILEIHMSNSNYEE